MRGNPLAGGCRRGSRRPVACGSFAWWVAAREVRKRPQEARRPGGVSRRIASKSSSVGVDTIAVFGSDNLKRTHNAETAAARTGNVRHTANLAAARRRQVLRWGVKMSQPRTLLVAIVALLLLIGAGFVAAQPLQCRGDKDDMEAVSAILADDKGKPATSEQIEANFHAKITIEAVDITRCLDAGRALVNHVIDYSQYVRALSGAQDRRSQLVIKDSVLWSPDRWIDLSRLGEERHVDHSIRWSGVVLGPGVSGLDTVFEGSINLYGATFHGEVEFDGAIFNGVARFYSGTNFRGRASFDDVQFRKDAYFHNKTTFHGRASFAGATFGGSSDNSSEDAGQAFFHAGTTFHGEADFEGATFNVKPHFRAYTFKSGVSFKDAVFNVEARFGRVTFPGTAWFQDAQFNMGASFRNAVFNRETTFAGAQFRQRADFDGVEFAKRAVVSFRRSIFEVEATFRRARFTGTTRFQKVQFNMGASFQKAVFNQEAVFAGTQFHQYVDFDDVTFAEESRISLAGVTSDAEADFGGITFPGATSLRDAEFNVGVSFAGSIFHAKAAFGGITFPRSASFQAARFNAEASFQKAVFIQQGIFEGAVFTGDLSFREAEIKGDLRLVDATWEGRADFRKSIIANLDWDSDERPSTVKGVFDAREAELKSMTIKDVYFSDLADFSGATFGNAASGTKYKILFEDVIFERAADFLRADFQADAIFVKNRFRGLLDITNATFAESARLCLLDNRIDELLMEREHLSTTHPWLLFLEGSADRLLESRFRALEVTTSGEAAQPYACAEPKLTDSNHEHLQRIYRSIESSFRNANDRWGENEAWYLGTVASRKAGGWLWNFVHGIFLDLPSRYGIDYIRALAVSAGWVLLFWPVYWFYFRWVFLKKHRELPVINLAAPPDQRRALRFRPFERLFHPVVPDKRPLIPWQDALVLSCRAFFKLGLGSSYPPVLACLVYVEWAVGTYMLIHFLFVLKNTLPIALPFLSG